MSRFIFKFKKGDTFDPKPPKHKLGGFRVFWVDTEPKYKPKYSVTTDWSRYIKESIG